MARNKNLKKLQERLEKTEEKLKLEKQKLKALKREFLKEFRKKEARFLIAIGRTLLKYGIKGKVEGEDVIILPLKNEAFRQAFKDYKEIVELNEKFKEWNSILESQERSDDAAQGGKEYPNRRTFTIDYSMID